MKDIDRRFIYLTLLAVIVAPILIGLALPPARMESAERVYQVVEDIGNEKFGLIAVDFGPGTQAENSPQAEVLIEHLMRRGIPLVVFSGYELGERFSIEIPQKVADKLNKESNTERYRYGSAWISLGFKPGRHIFLQALAKSEDLTTFIGKDYSGNSLDKYETFSDFKSLKNIGVVGQFTGLTGMLSNYIQFLQRSDYKISLVHGCTSITIPEAYIYLDSGQLSGAFEGIAGAAWYSKLLTQKNSERVSDDALIVNTSLGFAHLLIIFLILLGNISLLAGRRHG